MNKFATPSGTVGHYILHFHVVDGVDRAAVFACGAVRLESELVVNNELPLCSNCQEALNI